MPTPTEFFKFWIVDERTGKRRLTTYKLTRAQAADRYPGAEPDLQTREVRNLPERGEALGNTRPPGGPLTFAPLHDWPQARPRRD